MTNSKSTKRALLTSALAIVMCVAMLIGSTYAWFTDTASTQATRIKSGNLDIKLMYSTDMLEWKEATNETKLFENINLVEPGYTQTVYVKLVNAGELALKYALNIDNRYESSGKNMDNVKFKLSDYLKAGAVATDAAFATRDAAQAAVADVASTIGKGVAVAVPNDGVLASGESTDVIALVIYMPTSVGNEANHKKNFQPYIDLGLTVNATQAPVESDSFDNQYDAKAGDVILKSVQYTSGANELTTDVQASGRYGAVQVYGGTATINANVYAVYNTDAAMAVWARAQLGKTPAKVIINGGEFAQQGVPAGESCTLIYATDKATVEINGGTFKAASPKWTLNCMDGDGAVITVKGGSFYKYNPATDGQPGEVVVPAGYHVEQNGDWYTVVAD